MAHSMSRHCGTCGRPKTAEFHDKRPHRDPVRKALNIRWACRMTLVADSQSEPGKLLPTHISTRIEELNNRYVHTDRLEAQDG
jgi:hypothetical protein